MDLCKMQISKLDGTNWVPWKYRMSALLRGIDSLLDIIEGRIRKPVRPVVVDNEVDGAAVLADFNKKLNEDVTLSLLKLSENYIVAFYFLLISTTHSKSFTRHLAYITPGIVCTQPGTLNGEARSWRIRMAERVTQR
ncbi:hypothetical protein K1T71_002415 [Dendrolimus kikuchii]|uniref:Uncharacterized protein n=1 Tax=Dendrolimus kikuchii TaxID=765133 RepID=A0ACC1DDK2_9NEOP|nr:hypothetical protein K1T71_002415 [Dendrolimus kikuchii]